MAGTLVEGGFIRKDDAQPLFQGPGRVLAGLAVEAAGLHRNLTGLIDNDGDGFHGLGLHQDIQTNRAIGHHGLLAGKPLPAGFERRLTNCVSLLEKVELLGQAPETAEVVV